MRRALEWIVVALVLLGCTRRATQLMLVIDSDLDPTTYQCIGIEVARLDDGVPRSPSQFVSFAVPPTEVPFSLGILPPQNDASVRIEIRAEARTGACEDPNIGTPTGTMVVRSVTRAGFASEQTLRLPMFLGALCRGVTCTDAGTTCNPENGRCEMVMEQDPMTLMPVMPGTELDDAGAPPASDAGQDAGPEPDRVCPLQGNDYTDLASAPTRAFGLAITEPAREWVVLYDDAGSLHAIRIPYDARVESTVPSWTISGGADAIALEGTASGNALLALVNPTGTTDLVRHAGPLDGSVQTAMVGTGRLVQRGRHSALFGDRIATVIERGGGVAVVAIGASDTLADITTSPTPIAIALGNTPSGELLVALEGAQCEVRTYATSGTMTSTATMIGPGSGSTGCAPRAVTQLDDGRIVVLYATTTGGQARIRLVLYRSTGDQPSIRLSMVDSYASPIGALLGTDASFRATWIDDIDYPDVPGTDLMQGLVYWTDFTTGPPFSEYTDHGSAAAAHEQARWERRGLRTAVVLPEPTGFLFRTICRPTE